MFIVVWRFNNNFMMPDCSPKKLVYYNLFFVSGLFGFAKSGVEVWNDADKPVSCALSNERVFAFLYFAVLFLVEHYCWRRHVFVAHAQGTDCSLSGFKLWFGEVGRAAATFGSDYNPAIKQVIFSKFIVRH